MTPPLPGLLSSLREIEREEDQAQRLQQLRKRFGIEGGEPIPFPLFSPVLARDGGLAMRRVWVGDEDRTGYLLIEYGD